MGDSTDNSESKQLSHSKICAAIYDNLPLGVFVLRGKSVVYVNSAIAELIGISVEKLLEWTFEDFMSMLSVEDGEDAQLRYQTYAKSREIEDSLQYRFVHRSKGIRHIEIIPNTVVLNGKTTFHAIISDITDRVQAEDTLMKNQKKLTLYREIFSRSSDAIAVIDKEGKYIEQNDAHRTLIGYSDSYIRGRTPAIHLGDEVFRSINEELAATGSYRGETVSKTRTGKLVNIDISAFTITDDDGRPICHVGIKRDMSERTRAEEILRASEREKSIILDSMSDHVNYYDADDMRIVWTNTAAADSLGLTPIELGGKYCYELWHGSSEPCVDCPVIRARESGQPQENEMFTPDGRIWNIKGYPVKDDDGEVTGLVEVTRDITDQKKAYDETREAQARAELFNDLMAHDLNNINQGIMASLELILLSTEIPLDLRSQIEASLEQVKRGVGLISNVRKFSHVDREPLDLAPLDLYPSLVTAIETVKNTFPQRKVKVNCHIDRGDYQVIADEFLIDVFYNIMHNAAKNDQLDPVVIDIKAVEHKEEGKVEIRFEDYGPGIGDAMKETILKRLAEGGKGGTGIGLTLVQRIVDRYGGELLVGDRIEGDHS
ncbi:MAG: PAS domain-containing sensor histidine kinase, partial [Candidatus Thorarchaeota archaeon]